MDEFDLIGTLDRHGTDEAARAKILQTRLDRLQPFTRPPEEYAADYVATKELCAAVDVALSLGRPLLLTGEPGSGKTLAARWIADRLGLAGTHFDEFQVRSDSRARDLRYEFDAVGWFRKSQIEQTSVDKEPFLHARALGKAFGWAGDPTKPYVVLIDEIDKAPRDFPNDLLLELDQMRFTVDETQKRIGPPKQRPIIVITSNSERRLPDPFLRRCVTHHIELKPDTVMEILARRLKDFKTDQPLLQAAVGFWTGLDGRGLVRKPTIAEYWQWLALETRFGGRTPLEIGAALRNGGEGLGALRFLGTLFAPKDVQLLTARSAA